MCFEWFMDGMSVYTYLDIDTLERSGVGINNEFNSFN